MTGQNPLMTPDEIAELFRVTKKTVYNWNKSKKGPPRIRIAGKSFFRVADVDAFIEKQTTR